MLTSCVGKEVYPQAHSGAEWTQDLGPLPSITIPLPQPPAMAGSVMVPIYPLDEVKGSSDLSSPSSGVFRGSLKPFPPGRECAGWTCNLSPGAVPEPEAQPASRGG